MTTKTIKVVMEGGLIEDVIGLPPGYGLKVYDYDIDGADPDELESDVSGELYYPTIFGPEEEEDLPE